MSEFSHIEITIETVATDGIRTRMTRWVCPSVEVGSTGDGRVQLRFAGEPVIVAGEPTKPDTVRVTFDWAGFKADMEAAVAEHRRAHAVMQTCDDAPSGLCATEAERDVATDPRVGDVLTPPGLVMGYPVIEVTLDGDVWVQTYDVVGRGVFTREHWRIACRTPGAVIERAPG